MVVVVVVGVVATLLAIGFDLIQFGGRHRRQRVIFAIFSATLVARGGARKGGGFI